MRSGVTIRSAEPKRIEPPAMGFNAVGVKTVGIKGAVRLARTTKPLYANGVSSHSTGSRGFASAPCVQTSSRSPYPEGVPSMFANSNGGAQVAVCNFLKPLSVWENYECWEIRGMESSLLQTHCLSPLAKGTFLPAHAYPPQLVGLENLNSLNL